MTSQTKIVKGMNYTEKITRNNETGQETVQFWHRMRTLRAPKDCGVWLNGEKVADYSNMEIGVCVQFMEDGTVLDNPKENKEGEK